MRVVILSLLMAVALAGHAQSTTPVKVPEKAVPQLEKLLKQTQNVVVLGKRASSLPAESRPVLNRILTQSASEFLAVTSRQPTKEAYLQILDSGLSRIAPLVPQLEDRHQVAEYYQDLLDIVGLETSEGRLTAFVENTSASAKP